MFFALLYSDADSNPGRRSTPTVATSGTNDPPGGTDRLRAALRGALGGRTDDVRVLVDSLSPVIHARVARRLIRRAAAGRGRDVRQEIEDMTQDVFVALFRDDAKLLRAWDPDRGMGLKGFVGMVAEQQVAQRLRSQRRNPWTEDPTENKALSDDRATSWTDPETKAVTRDLARRLMDDVKADLSPQGLDMFHRLFEEQQAVDAICADLGMKPDAVYAWRSRLSKRLSAVFGQLRNAPTGEAAP